MRAPIYEKNGLTREVLHFGEIDTPIPGPGEVRVKLKTSGVNPSDVKACDQSPLSGPGGMLV